MAKKRFSKATLLETLEKKAIEIAKTNNFDPTGGTHQLRWDSERECYMVLRAVQYGRMKAFEEIASSIKGENP